MKKYFQKSVFICVENLRLSVGIITLLFSLSLLLFSCIKLEENDKRYSARKLREAIKNAWFIYDYQIEGVSYLDSLKLTFDMELITTQKNKYDLGLQFNKYKYIFPNNGSDGYESGSVSLRLGSKQEHRGYNFQVRKKKVTFSSTLVPDTLIFFQEINYDIIKLEGEQLILRTNDKRHKIFFERR